VRRGGGTGRRIGLKIRRPHKGRAGSIPAPGTKFALLKLIHTPDLLEVTNLAHAKHSTPGSETTRAIYRVTVRRPDGTQAAIVPFALADLNDNDNDNDNDNNHSSCLDVTDTVLATSFPARHVVDANGDLNPDTRVVVTR
jgi:hypothetical protein